MDRPRRLLLVSVGTTFRTDSQILVVSADVPPQDGETDEQRQERENTNAVRAIRRQQNIAATAQVQANNQDNNRSTRDKSTPKLGNKHLWHQLPLSNGATMTHLVPIDYVRETSSKTSSVTDSKFITRRKPIWESLLPS
jgi:type II secretory pathway pseudopilin PulG